MTVNLVTSVAYHVCGELLILEPLAASCLVVCSLLPNRYGRVWSCLLFYPHHDRLARIDRASQVLAQGVPPGVPKSYRALTDHGNVP
jgi:hypothetical protein